MKNPQYMVSRIYLLKSHELLSCEFDGSKKRSEKTVSDVCEIAERIVKDLA